MTFRTRFAPSPTGPLHLGHAYSAAVAYHRAQARGGSFLLRIEDVDRARSKPEWEHQIFDDLQWLGLTWSGTPRRQSTHRADHDGALDRLNDMGLLYPCRCRRADIRAALSAPQEGVDGLIYPGTCRGRSMTDMEPGDAIRLDMAKAVALAGKTRLRYSDETPTFCRQTEFDPVTLIETAGDVVLGRRDTGDIAYHLAVVVDDAAQEITEVVRGADLHEATALHVLLQHLLGLPTPAYFHHALVRDDAGKRLAKRDDARAIAAYRDAGLTPEDVMDLAIKGAGGVTPWA